MRTPNEPVQNVKPFESEGIALKINLNLHKYLQLLGFQTNQMEGHLDEYTSLHQIFLQLG